MNRAAVETDDVDALEMSAIAATHTATSKPKRSFRRRYSIARGNACQAAGIVTGSATLAAATQLRNSSISTAPMLAGFTTGDSRSARRPTNLTSCRPDAGRFSLLCHLLGFGRSSEPTL